MKYPSVILFMFLLTCSGPKATMSEPLPDLANGGPPPAPAGYHWERNPNFSDEFDGDQLDADKWHDRSPYWVNGRPPATFRASTVSVKDGLLQIRNQPLNEEDPKYHIAGGAVASVTRDGYHGYYATRMKASGISMSSTFWMKNKPEKDDCRSVQHELDIIEIVGKQSRGGDFRNVSHSNTHIFHRD
ncbi:MAG: hypothetical protein AAFZ52_03475, partial [Bacteroidota bacterium]